MESMPLASSRELVPLEKDGTRYLINSLHFKYVEEHAEHPSLESLHDLEVELLQSNRGFVYPREGEEAMIFSRAEWEKEKAYTWFYSTALIKIAQTVVAHFHKIGLSGVHVSVDPNQINESGEDIRSKGNHSLTFLVKTYPIKEVKTISKGLRFKEEYIINSPKHHLILANSPVQTGAKNLLLQDVLDDYLSYVNRYPGRRVDAQLTGAEVKGMLNLDFLVTDDRPIKGYVHTANSGTEGTRKWIERIGFIHYHLTGADDIFSFEYATAGFEDFHSVRASYDRPILSLDRTRLKIDAAWSEFSASQFGIEDDLFLGNQERVGIIFTRNIFQKKELFLDLIGGARWHHIMVNNKLLQQRGKEDFLIPTLGIHLEQKTRESKLFAGLSMEWNMGGVAETKAGELPRLGRTNTSVSWLVLKGNLQASYYFDKWFDSYEPTKPLKHELYFGFAGQYAFNERLIPQMQRVIGGSETVRGYPQSLAVGDSAFSSQLEYRYHLALEKFHLRPTFFVFVDGGRTVNNSRLSFEHNQSLLSSGIGFELLYKEHVKLHIDLGFALKRARFDDVQSGDNELHISLVFVY